MDRPTGSKRETAQRNGLGALGTLLERPGFEELGAELALIAHGRDALLVTDAARLVLYANPRFLELFGLPPTQPDRATIESLLGPQVFEPAAASLDRPESRELRRADGSRLVVEIDAAPVRNGTSTVGQRVLFRDVTERWLHEQTLDALCRCFKTVERSEFLAGVVRELARLLDLEVATLAVPVAGRAALRLLATVRDAAPVKTVDIPLAGTTWAETFAQDRVHQSSAPVLGACLGASFLAQGFAGVPLFDGRAEPFGLLAVTSQSPLRQPERVASVLRTFALGVGSELARRRAESRFEDFYEHAPDATLILDETNVILLANRRSMRLFQCTREQLVGCNVARLLPPSTGPADMLFRGSTSTSKRMRVQAQRFDGTGFPAEVRYRPMLLNDATLVAVTVRDVTELLQADQRRHLLESQLLQAQKMEAMGTLAGGIAHDFNNVLATIKANVDLARLAMSRNESFEDVLEEIESSASHAMHLVRRILAFSRREESKRTVHSIRRPIDQAVALLRPLLPPTVTLTVMVEPKPPKVLGDVNQLQQVLVNLGTNAWHALDDQHGQISISQDQVSVIPHERPGLFQPARFVRVIVSDAGRGIDSAILPRIFEPFFTTKPVGVGTGLGLSMVHNIIRDHGGTVTVDSVVGEGTSFTVLLPIAEGPPESEAPAPPPTSSTSQQRRVMVVDDEPALGRAAGRFLSKLGYAVSVFNDPREALTTFEADPSDFDLLVLDSHMPGLTGLEFARAALETEPEMPIILVSGRIDAAHSKTAESLGIAAVLDKPYGMSDLSEAIQRALQDSSR